jgi:transposase/uncharacterized protein YecT (DUF1311 family)
MGSKRLPASTASPALALVCFRTHRTSRSAFIHRCPRSDIRIPLPNAAFVLLPFVYGAGISGRQDDGIVLADKAYDTNPVRQLIEGQGAAPNIPSKVTRRWKSCFSPVLYKGRNAIERMFCRLKDFRRLATRYDKLGQLPRQRTPRRGTHLVVMSPGPSANWDSPRFKSCRDRASAMVDLRDCLADEVARSEAALDAAFAKRLALQYAGDRPAMIAREREWKKFRDADCSAEATRGGPSITAGNADAESLCALQQTNDRIAHFDNKYG